MFSIFLHKSISAFSPSPTHTKFIKSLFPNAKLWSVSHHLCHAASTVFTSPFNSGSFLTIDGMGSGLWDFARGYPTRYENNSIGYFNKDKKIFRSFYSAKYLDQMVIL